MTTPIQGTVCNPNAQPSSGEPYCTKVDSSSISHSWNMDGALKFKMGHVTYNHAPFKDSL